MSPARDFGEDHPDNNDQPHDSDDEESHTLIPQPEPDNDQPQPDRAIEAPQPAADRFDVDTPSVGQLYAMFPDALPNNRPDRKKRHLAAVPGASEVAALPDDVDDETVDSLVATALRLRVLLTFWWRPTVTVLTVTVIAICAFTVAGAVVGIAWCAYGIGWSAHSIWHAHGRPELRQLHRARRSRW
ncbi:hypothetical protein [Nocardia sp. NPDC059228]|uniref:hypothetical protein n=1 Tax=Nocardia sp. NPDC059228 TaxID=3346777 RepID=UPI00368BCEA0